MTGASTIWPLLVAQILTILPVAASSVSISAIATDIGRSVALVGGLRSLGGAAALACGVLLAPLIDRVGRAWLIAGSLALLAVANLLAAQATLTTLALFSLLSGMAGAIFQPASLSAAADGRDGPTGARAAMLSAVAALAPTLAAPLLVVPAG